MQTISREAITQALAYWCDQEPATPPTFRLSRNAKRLAEVYGVMLWEQALQFPRDRMTAEQLAAFTSVPADAFRQDTQA
jgi:hypothetical protein